MNASQHVKASLPSVPEPLLNVHESVHSTSSDGSVFPLHLPVTSVGQHVVAGVFPAGVAVASASGSVWVPAPQLLNSTQYEQAWKQHSTCGLTS